MIDLKDFKIGSLKFQWIQLWALTFIHFYADMCGGILPAVLPRIREEFGLSLVRGINMITLLSLICNSGQVFIGHLHLKGTKPRLLVIGVVLASFIMLFGLVPKVDSAQYFLFVMVFITAIGIAMVHPESLRAVHSLDKISSSMSTAVFMNGGFLGYSGGALISTTLVYLLGLKGLLCLLLIAAVGLTFLMIFKIRLAHEDSPENIQSNADIGVQFKFWRLFIMAVPVATASTILVGLLPTRLSELGFKLYFGGMPLMLFGGGGAAGSIFWAVLAERRGKLNCAILAELIAVPFILVNLAFIKNPWAVWVLLPAGFCASAGFSLIVAMARHSVGANFSKRMGFIVGGVWGLASIILMALGPVAQKFGVQSVLNLVWVGYLAGGIFGLLEKRRLKLAAQQR